MPWIAYIAHFIAAAFLTNGVPHFVNGVSGRPFRIPFAQGAKPGSPTANVVWGWANFLIAFLLFALHNSLNRNRFKDKIMQKFKVLQRPLRV